MNEKTFCPDCGFEFTQGDGNGNYCYEDGMTYYTCPECGWKGTHYDVLNTENATDKLEDAKSDFELDGVELTDEDAEAVIKKVVEDGENLEDAVSQVLSSIRKTLDDGLNDEYFENEIGGLD